MVTLGNGLSTHKAFDPETGRLASIRTGLGGGSEVQHHTYAWNADGHLADRQDLNRSLQENFGYDAQHRLARRADRQ